MVDLMKFIGGGPLERHLTLAFAQLKTTAAGAAGLRVLQLPPVSPRRQTALLHPSLPLSRACSLRTRLRERGLHVVHKRPPYSREGAHAGAAYDGTTPAYTSTLRRNWAGASLRRDARDRGRLTGNTTRARRVLDR
jgi:hypothetical protein